MTLPPDRSHVPTESRLAEAAGSDALPTADYLRLMSDGDEAAVAAVRAIIPDIAALVDAVAERYKRGGRLIYAGAGTSGRLGVLDASECPPTFSVEPGRVVGIIAGGDGALRISSEGREDEYDGICDAFETLAVAQDDTVVGITAGGTTPYALGAIAHGATRGAMTALLTCGIVPKSPTPDHVLHARTGPEVLVGSTRLKAGTATKLVLNMISTGLMVRIGSTHDDLMVSVRATNDKLRDRAARTLSWLLEVDRVTAFDLLERANGSVKVAAVMHTHGTSADAAGERLRDAGNQLREALQ